MTNKTKRIASVLVALILVAFSCVSAFAAESPTGSKDVSIIIHPSEGGTGTYEIEVEYGQGPNGGKVINFFPKPNDGYTFDKWELKGDYDIIKGSLKEAEFSIEAYSDIEATPYYTKGTGTDTPSATNATSASVVSNTGKTSPQTGDSTYVVFAVVAVLVAAAGVVVVKRKMNDKG